MTVRDHECRRSRRRGFTLIEIFVGVATMGIVMLMGIPRLATAARHSRVNQAATVVAGDLELAFSLAARQRRPVRISYASGASDFLIADRGSGTVFRRRALTSESEWKLSSVSFSQPAVDVFPNGSASAPLTVALRSGGYSRQVTMSRVGLVRIAP